MYYAFPINGDQELGRRLRERLLELGFYFTGTNDLDGRYWTEAIECCVWIDAGYTFPAECRSSLMYGEWLGDSRHELCDPDELLTTDNFRPGEIPRAKPDPRMKGKGIHIPMW